MFCFLSVLLFASAVALLPLSWIPVLLLASSLALLVLLDRFSVVFIALPAAMSPLFFLLLLSVLVLASALAFLHPPWVAVLLLALLLALPEPFLRISVVAVPLRPLTLIFSVALFALRLTLLQLAWVAVLLLLTTLPALPELLLGVSVHLQDILSPAPALLLFLVPPLAPLLALSQPLRITLLAPALLTALPELLFGVAVGPPIPPALFLLLTVLFLALVLAPASLLLALSTLAALLLALLETPPGVDVVVGHDGGGREEGDGEENKGGEEDFCLGDGHTWKHRRG